MLLLILFYLGFMAMVTLDGSDLQRLVASLLGTSSGGPSRSFSSQIDRSEFAADLMRLIFEHLSIDGQINALPSSNLVSAIVIDHEESLPYYLGSTQNLIDDVIQNTDPDALGQDREPYSISIAGTASLDYPTYYLSLFPEYLNKSPYSEISEEGLHLSVDLNNNGEPRLMVGTTQDPSLMMTFPREGGIKLVSATSEPLRPELTKASNGKAEIHFDRGQSEVEDNRRFILESLIQDYTFKYGAALDDFGNISSDGNGSLQASLFFKNPDDGDSILGSFQLQFEPNLCKIKDLNIDYGDYPAGLERPQNNSYPSP